jgi:hypothetical protein
VTGQIVRCHNEENDVTGVILIASPNGEAIVVEFSEPEGIRMNGGLGISRTLALRVDYEAETITDLFGGAWEIDVGSEA